MNDLTQFWMFQLELFASDAEHALDTRMIRRLEEHALTNHARSTKDDDFHVVCLGQLARRQAHGFRCLTRPLAERAEEGAGFLEPDEERYLGVTQDACWRGSDTPASLVSFVRSL